MAPRVTLLHPAPPPARPDIVTGLVTRALRGTSLSEGQHIHLPGLPPLRVEASDGGVLERGDAVEIIYPDRNDGPPWDVVFLLDGSATMGRRIRERSRLEEAVLAIHAWTLNGRDVIERAAVLAHASAPIRVNPLADLGELQAHELLALRPRGGLDAQAALAAAVDLLDESEAPGRAIVVLTDDAAPWTSTRALGPVRRAGVRLLHHLVLPEEGTPSKAKETLADLGARTGAWLPPPPPPPPGTPFEVVIERDDRGGRQPRGRSPTQPPGGDDEPQR